MKILIFLFLIFLPCMLISQTSVLSTSSGTKAVNDSLIVCSDTLSPKGIEYYLKRGFIVLDWYCKTPIDSLEYFTKGKTTYIGLLIAPNYGQDTIYPYVSRWMRPIDTTLIRYHDIALCPTHPEKESKAQCIYLDKDGSIWIDDELLVRDTTKGFFEIMQLALLPYVEGILKRKK